MEHESRVLNFCQILENFQIYWAKLLFRNNGENDECFHGPKKRKFGNGPEMDFY